MINNELHVRSYTYPFADRVNPTLSDIIRRYNNDNIDPEEGFVPRNTQ